MIPLDNKGQISLSREGPVREFNSLSLRPSTNLSPIRNGSGGVQNIVGMMPASSMDNQLKLRQLEMNLLDFKGAVDRRLVAFNEDMP